MPLTDSTIPDLELSILITYFNEGEFLTFCLESLLKQNVENLEVIIFDDASGIEASKFVPEVYLPIIRVIRSEVNVGPGAGRTILLKEAKGKYVHYHDSDDLFEDTWYKRVSQVIKDLKIDVILTGVQSIDENGNIISKDVMGINKISDEPLDLLKFGLAGSILVPSTTFKRELGLRVGGYKARNELKQSEDFHFHLSLALLKPTVFLIKAPLIIQRIRINSHSKINNGMIDCFNSGIKALDMLEDQIEKKYQAAYSAAYARLGQKLLQLKRNTDARKAFERSHRLGLPSFLERSFFFRLSVKVIGLERSETLSLRIQKLRRRF